MKVWVVGSGGREHALVWKLSQEASVEWLSVGEVRERMDLLPLLPMLAGGGGPGLPGTEGVLNSSPCFQGGEFGHASPSPGSQEKVSSASETDEVDSPSGRERGGGLNSSPCLQGEVASERSEDDGGGADAPPSPSFHSGTPPCMQGGEFPDLVVIGPEDPLIDGLADDLRARGIRVYGPNADGARLEGSKAFCKEVMDAAGVPTAKFQTFTDSQAAKDYATAEWNQGRPVVVKASGAALGKGVVVPADLPEALDAINAMMERGELGDAGKEIVLEQRLNGFEFSLLVLVSGTEYLSLPVAQDYKRAFDGDEGPNTGGMGTYSPVPHVTPELVQRTEREVIEPTLKELRNRGIDYRGTLFAGLMVQDGDPYCLEFNVRFGDPETQTVMRRLGAGFLDALVACAEGRAVPEIEVLDNAVVTVVLAAQGYPGAYEKGHRVNAPSLVDNLVLFRAGMTEDGISTGGRVLGVSAAASTLELARSDAYAAIQKIDAPGLFCRRDIAQLE